MYWVMTYEFAKMDPASPNPEKKTRYHMASNQQIILVNDKKMEMALFKGEVT